MIAIYLKFCHTLSQYVHKKHCFNNLLRTLLPGNHTLDVTIPLRGLTCLEKQLHIVQGIGSSRLSFTDNTFQNNRRLRRSTWSKRGWYSQLTGNIFQGNSADHGQGGTLEAWGSTVSLTGNTFQDNTAYLGGVLAAQEGSTFSFTGIKFQNNTAYVGGALPAEYSSTLNTFQDNSADNVGGAIAAFDSQLTQVEDTTSENSKANYGGGCTI